MKSLIKWMRVIPVAFGVAILGAGCGETAVDDGITVATPDAVVTTDAEGDVNVDLPETTPGDTPDIVIETETPTP